MNKDKNRRKKNSRIEETNFDVAIRFVCDGGVDSIIDRSEKQEFIVLSNDLTRSSNEIAIKYEIYMYMYIIFILKITNHE